MAPEAHLGVTGGKEPQKTAGNYRVRSQSRSPSDGSSPTPGPSEQMSSFSTVAAEGGVT